MQRLVITVIAFLVTAASGALAGDLGWSDPAALSPPAANAIGWPSRAADFDALPGFVNPPPGFGEVAFYWWLGDPLTRERLAWQLDRLQESGGVMGLQVNYAHSDRGGRSYGLTYPSHPPLFSEAWWDLFRWFLGEAKRRGMAASLSDYTLGIPGQGWWVDEILKENPDLCGATLESEIREAAAGAEVAWTLPQHTLSVTAWRVGSGGIEAGTGIDLRSKVSGGTLRWRVPEGRWKLLCVSYRREPMSIDPMNPLAGKKVVEKFFHRFEARCPGEGGRGLNFFFSDELSFGVSGRLWNGRFAEEFRKRKGYDLVAELPALFLDTGPRAPKVRLDYSDVLVTLSEEGYFRPLFQWHYERGMTYGCDHGGRGRNVVEFGDYFRTQRWMTAPGNDSPALSADIIKNKVASSIAHLYQRPRVWLEGYHSSGWGTSTAQLVDATQRNFVLGHNLLTLHGLYYTTHGGWWEWAPPCNHFRMPYWPHMKDFFRFSQRLSYLLSQGVHRCDVAIVYPVAAMEAGMDGDAAVAAAFGLGTDLFTQGIDFDFLDFESLARAQVADKELRVSGEAYRVLVLPSMRAVRDSTIRKALEFCRAGGIVVGLGALPEASDRAGREDAELDAVVREIFSVTAADARSIRDLRANRNPSGGIGLLAQKAEQVARWIDRSLVRDFALVSAENRSRAAKPQVLHRKIGPRDVYMVLGAPRDCECFFRAKGKVELWDPWSGAVRPLYAASPTRDGTRVRMPLAAEEAQLIVFNPGASALTVEKTNLDEVDAVSQEDGKITVRGFAGSAGRKTARIRAGDRTVEVAGGVVASPQQVNLSGPWEFELVPTMDNHFGDFRWPPTPTLLGAEARQLRYADEGAPNPGWHEPGLDDSKWPKVTCSFGPRFWKLGPLPQAAEAHEVESRLAAGGQVDPATPVQIGGKRYTWQPYSFSTRWGIEEDPGHEGYHGLKELVSDEFIALGKRTLTWTSSTYEKENAGPRYYLWTSVPSGRAGQARALSGGSKPAAAWLNGKPLDPPCGEVQLRSGANGLLLRYDGPGRGYFVLDAGAGREADEPPRADQVSPLAMRWYGRRGVLPYDTRPQVARPAGWYRFVAPPGLRRMTIVARGAIQAWAGGKPMTVTADGRRDDGSRQYRATVTEAAPGPVKVAIRVEQERGCYGGAALPESVALDCGPGRIALGDWSQIDGLASYSGGAWYRTTATLTPQQAAGRVTLNLGSVSASAAVRVNGMAAGVRLAPPWKLDISRFARPGKNRIEVLVYNTLANHYSTIPTRYRGSPVSGLLGPVSIETASQVVLRER